MSELDSLYREVILDHNRDPRNFGEIEGADRVVEGVNPLCGDKVRVFLKVEDGRVADAAFQGAGCAISTASASLMTDALKGKTIEEAQRLFDRFHRLRRRSRLRPLRRPRGRAGSRCRRRGLRTAARTCRTVRLVGRVW